MENACRIKQDVVYHISDTILISGVEDEKAYGSIDYRCPCG